MSAGNDILQLMPEIAAIGYEQLQAYCNDWLKRPFHLRVKRKLGL